MSEVITETAAPKKRMLSGIKPSGDLTLGYSPVEISAALKGIDPTASTEEMVRFALRAMVMKG